METLRLKVDEIHEPRQPWRRELSKAFLTEIFQDARGWSVRDPAPFIAHVTKVGETNVLLEGSAILAVQSECRRCLDEVVSDLPLVFTVSLVAKPPAPTHSRRKQRPTEDSGEGDLSASFEEAELDNETFDGHTIDVGPILREHLLLGLPAFEPLCQEGCKGLCTTCGENLNRKDCGHSQKPVDPRWSALSNIKV